eukprot:5942400-Ditylum_brightwellii.AAC.1
MELLKQRSIRKEEEAITLLLKMIKHECFQSPKKIRPEKFIFETKYNKCSEGPHDVVHLPEKSDPPPAVVKQTEHPPVQTKTTTDSQDPTVEVPGLLSK